MLHRESQLPCVTTVSTVEKTHYAHYSQIKIGNIEAKYWSCFLI